MTKFNMAHILIQNDQTHEALRNWAEVYDVASKIGLAQVLEALEGLAEHLELPGGLEGWKTVLDNLDNDNP